MHLISRKGIGLAYLPQLVFVICLLRHLDTRYMYTGRFCAGCARDLVIRILRLAISRALRTFRPLKACACFSRCHRTTRACVTTIPSSSPIATNCFSCRIRRRKRVFVLATPAGFFNYLRPLRSHLHFRLPAYASLCGFSR